MFDALALVMCFCGVFIHFGLVDVWLFVAFHSLYQHGGHIRLLQFFRVQILNALSKNPPKSFIAKFQMACVVAVVVVVEVSPGWQMFPFILVFLYDFGCLSKWLVVFPRKQMIIHNKKMLYQGRGRAVIHAGVVWGRGDSVSN